MPTNIDLVFVCLFVFPVYTESTSLEAEQHTIINAKESEIGEHTNVLDSLLTTTPKVLETNIQIKQPSQIPKKEVGRKYGDVNNHRTNFNNEFPLEGGYEPLQTSETLPINNQPPMEVIDDSIHAKGSKGRKGVEYPMSPIVPRKGVDQVEATDINSSISKQTINQSSKHNSSTTGSTDNIFLNSSETKKPQAIIDQSHVPVKIVEKLHKKPETVSDIEDVDDFDKYSIIKTSTTGEDYVIIGIVIVIGIWFSVFGALIFYRRAGEYWDRRHYRRMDFLVEGMYND